MILIISQDNFDESTNDVIDWLDLYGASYLRINAIDIVKSSYLCLTNQFGLKLFVNDKQLELDEVNVVWMRRWYTEENLKEIALKVLDTKDVSFSFSLNRFMRDEILKYNEFIMEMFKDKSLNSTSINGLNKIKVLFFAQKFGLNIPDTHILSKKCYNSYLAKNQKYITKAISEAPDIHLNKKLFLGYTKEVKIDNKRDFSLSLLQSKIEKRLEIRSFVLQEKIWSMAIFSQNNKSTIDDFRVYDWKNPNRYCPYKLPSSIERKIFVLFKHLELETGSIDLILTKSNKIIF